MFEYILDSTLIKQFVFFDLPTFFKRVACVQKRKFINNQLQHAIKRLRYAHFLR